MVNKILIPVLIVAALGAGYYFLMPESSSENVENILATVEEDQFTVSVTSTGELKAKRSEKIRGPEGMRAAGIWQTNIADLITEGTLVGEGDYVGRLDRSELDGKLQNLASEIEKIESQLLQTKLDTAINLRGLRDQLVNLQFSMKEKKLEVQQSQFEPPAVIRRVELDLERIERDYKQQMSNYKLKQEQAEAQIQEIMATLEQNTRKYKMMAELGNNFVVKAPKEGMVIYERNWDGSKKGPGSRISTWNPVIAQLPDLTDMVSQTYVNEVDISKVQLEQEVKVRIDAFPEKLYKGKVIKIANIGEQLRKFDAKVFEVTVQMLENDSILRPAMTSSNEIVTEVLDKALFIPIETLHNDSLTYVFKKTAQGTVKQEVITGVSNDNSIVILYGLEKDEEVYLTIPDNKDDLTIVELSEEDKKAHEAAIAKAKREEAEAAARRKAEMEERVKALEVKTEM